MLETHGTDAQAGARPLEGNSTAERLARVTPGPRWLWLYTPLILIVSLFLSGNLYPDFYGRYINPEIGALELTQFFVMCVATVVAAGLLRHGQVWSRGWLRAWVGLALVCSFYVAGEEASWGQHIVGWSTPEYWENINDQNETNLHNVSPWFNQKPRHVLEAAIIIGGLILPFLARSGRLGVGRINYLVPPLAGVPTAAIVAFRRLDEARLELSEGASSLFYRSSEVQELFMYLFVLFYLLALRRRLDVVPPPR
ncbi:MAG: hypothetical protein EA405_15235 [Rhodospirillales bacterium]|nr:MAG: hypothetical protein EA405_15235 [Rhodospirillales bacterium]TVR98125.1 MAG: hypothetical protein EA406_07775 [Rhodospirillales bacterium]